LARLGIRHIEQSPAEPTRAAMAQALRQQVLAALAGAGRRAGNMTSAS